MNSAGKSFDFIHQKPQKHFSRADDYNLYDSVLHCKLKKIIFAFKGRQNEFKFFTDK